MKIHIHIENLLKGFFYYSSFTPTDTFTPTDIFITAISSW